MSDEQDQAPALGGQGRPLTAGEAAALIAPGVGIDPGDVGGWVVVILSKHDVVRVASGPVQDESSARYLLGLGLAAVTPDTRLSDATGGA